MEHTKGEWTPNTFGVSIYDWERDNYYTIADCYPKNHPPTIELTEVEANAHLIAAAPDMYEACQKLADWDNSHDDATLISEACSLARQALSKAEGKEV